MCKNKTSSEFSVWKEPKMLFEQLWQSDTAATAAAQYKGISKTHGITACGVCHGTTCCYSKNTFYLAEKWRDEVAIKNSRIVLFTCMAGHSLFFPFLCECTENAHKMSWGWSFQVSILVSSQCPLIMLSIFSRLILGNILSVFVLRFYFSYRFWKTGMNYM